MICVTDERHATEHSAHTADASINIAYVWKAYYLFRRIGPLPELDVRALPIPAALYTARYAAHTRTSPKSYLES